MILTERNLLFFGLMTLFILIIIILLRRIFLRKLKGFAEYRYEFILPSKQILQPKGQDFEKELKLTAAAYEKSNVEHIVLIHGTFAGDDPLFLNRTIAKYTPHFFRPLHSFFRTSFKKSFDVVGQDLGNFTKRHKKLLEKNFKQNVSLFNWSGSNSHYGRFHGLIELIDFLSTDTSKNYLLMAHSHGGQLLALMTQLFWDESIKEELLKEKLISQRTISRIKGLRSLKYNFVTMGTPVRYKWTPSANIAIQHFINHRGSVPLGGSILGGLWNQKGDYVQQFAGAGSDYFPMLDVHKQVNKKLALIFKEEDLGVLILLKRRQRLHPQGLNLLVDYQDAKFYPNFYKTIFGHGVYTRYHLLNFHLKQILKNLI